MQYILGPNKLPVDISLPDGTGKRIMFNLSGGADSAILLYVLAKLNRDAGYPHAIVPHTVPRPDNGAAYVNAIIDWINAKLGTDVPHSVIHGDGNLRHDIVMPIAIGAIWRTGNFDVIYIGETTNPPVELSGMAPVRTKEPLPYVKMPFLKFTKDCTIDLYYVEDVLDLLALTHSCTEKTVGRCGICYQCSERIWAFEQLGRVDPGVK